MKSLLFPCQGLEGEPGDGLCRPQTVHKLVSKVEGKAMAPQSGTVAWKIPLTEEPGGLQSMGSLRVGHFHFSLSCTGEGNGNPLQFLAWRILGMVEPGGLLSMGSHRVGHD